MTVNKNVLRSTTAKKQPVLKPLQSAVELKSATKASVDLLQKKLLLSRAKYREQSACLGATPLLFWLVEEFNPTTTLCISATEATTYFACCQAIERTNSIARASYIGLKEHDQSTALSQSYNANNYSDFSTLHFSSVLPVKDNIVPKQVDLLLIDCNLSLDQIVDVAASVSSIINTQTIIILTSSDSVVSGYYEKLLSDLNRDANHSLLFDCGGGVVVNVGAIAAHPSLAAFIAAGDVSAQRGELQRVFRNLGLLQEAWGYKSDGQTKEDSLSQDLALCEAQKRDLESQLASRSQGLEKLKLAYSARAKIIAELQAKGFDQALNLQTFEHVKGALAEATARIGELNQAEIVRAVEIDRLSRELERVGASLTESQAANKEDATSGAASQRKIQALEEAQKALEVEHEAALKTYQTAIDDAARSNDSKLAQIKALEKAHEALKAQHEEALASSQAERQDAMAVNDAKLAEIEALKKAYDALETRHEETLKTYQTASKEVAAANDSKLAQIKALEKAHEALSAQHDATLQTYQSEIKVATAAHAAKLAQISVLEAKQTKNLCEIQSLTQLRLDLSTRVEHLQNEVASIEKTNIDLTGKASRAASEIKRLLEQVQKLETDLTAVKHDYQSIHKVHQELLIDKKSSDETARTQQLLAMKLARDVPTGLTQQLHLREHAKRLAKSPLFDAQWYNNTHSGRTETGLSAENHYLLIGSYLGLDPSPSFKTLDYYRANPDVAQEGACALLHYLTAGMAEGRPMKPPQTS